MREAAALHHQEPQTQNAKNSTRFPSHPISSLPSVSLLVFLSSLLLQRSCFSRFLLKEERTSLVLASIPLRVSMLVSNKEHRRQQDEARQHILNQILHPEAADRLGRIRLVKEQRATDIENRLIMLAQTGQVRQKVTEAQLKDLLNAVADNKEEEKIVVSRRKGWDDDDDDLLDL